MSAPFETRDDHRRTALWRALYRLEKLLPTSAYRLIGFRLLTSLEKQPIDRR